MNNENDRSGAHPQTMTDRNMRRGALWNVIGSSLYAVVSMILGTLVIRVLGGDLGGIFFFAFSTLGQHIYVISYFGMRAIQSTDTGVLYTFGEYKGLRVWTAAAGLAVGIVAALAYAGLSYKAAVIIIVAVYRVLDGYVDIYECEMQRGGRLDLTGKSMAVRTLAVMAAFLLVMLITKDLILSSAALVIALAAVILLYDIPKLKTLGKADNDVRPGNVRKLFDESVWLFIGVFLDFLIFAASKYAVDAKLSSAMSGYYSTLFVPASAMLLFANFIVRPLLPKMSEAYLSGDVRGLRKILTTTTLVIAAVTVAAAVIAYFIGVPVLCIFAGEAAYKEMISYRFALALIVAAGGIYAMATPVYYAMVIGKLQKVIFRVYLIIAVIAFALAFVMVGSMGITGGAWSMVISLVLLFTGFCIASRRMLKNGTEAPGALSHFTE